ncbi:DUF1145 domain-containing protein [Shewanella sp. YLB-07]|uniref:DUF1145 domain-containing protein n=1 Tax=Shewanella sp. YLB-07 TaxID=2601268 RepID=UPI00128B2C2C|nr:DUF1145 domain-containing protein [Shewanella sp. YLB-07]MPY25436.1 DUF1145 domain-containing protein [Shewanella sp. YLB-07]
MKFNNVFIMTGKAITLLAWLMMTYNLVQPFEGNTTVILNILFAVTLFMHSFQVVILHTRFKSRLTLHKSDYLNVFAFGIFSLLSYRQQSLLSVNKGK